MIDKPNREEILDAALSIRNQRAVEEQIRLSSEAVKSQMEMFKEMMRLAVEESKPRTVEEMQQDMVAILQQVANVLEFFKQRLEAPLMDPPVLNVTVPPNPVTLEQQPVVVNVPESAVQITPRIEVPVPTVTVEQPKAGPRKATIKHSDGTQSTVEFSRT